MKFRDVSLIALLALIFSCTTSSSTETTDGSDTLVADPDVDMATSDPVEEPAEFSNINIDYSWPDSWELGQQFTPFWDMLTEISDMVKVRDSIYFAHEYTLTAADSAYMKPLEDAAYNRILAYSEKMRSGIKVPKGKAPSRKGVLRGEDESFGYLTENQSRALDGLDFIFVGGSPFSDQSSELFKDAAGNPETRYTIQTAENALYFFNYVYSRNPGPVETSYGGPLSTYEGTAGNFNGIGTVIHTLSKRIPVWFLTKDGAIPAALVSVEMKLGTEYGCNSNNPEYVFACSKNIASADIFGVFYSDTNVKLDRSSIRQGNHSAITEFDLDGDENADIAQITGTFSGASSDQMLESIWYARINGTWVVLDYASQPDCT